jgi:hypothetical protein
VVAVIRPGIESRQEVQGDISLALIQPSTELVIYMLLNATRGPVLIKQPEEILSFSENSSAEFVPDNKTCENEIKLRKPIANSAFEVVRFEKT